MKFIPALLPVLLIASVLPLLAAEKEEEAFDINTLTRQTDAIFHQKMAPKVLAAERSKIESLLPRERANRYMKQFEMGMKSATGMILIEGGENGWLERAHRAGYEQKMFFQEAYREGMAHALK